MTEPGLTSLLSENVSRSERAVCILILGSHRSGTSALARVLNIQGCTLPATLIGASYGNDKGHWESATITTFDDELLDSAGSNWGDCLPINPKWYKSPVYPRFLERARALLQTEYGQSPLFVLKDPRICRIAPIWLDALAKEGIDPAIILPIRHPADVAGSLERRDETPEWFGQLIWLRHTLDAEEATRGRNRVFTSYPQLLSDWRTVVASISAVLDLNFPRQTASSANEIDEFLEARPEKSTAPTLSFAKFSAKNADVSVWLTAAYDILVSWTETGENSDHYAMLDDIRKAFNQASYAFGSVLLPSLHSGTYGDGVRRREALEQRLVEADSQVQQAVAEAASSASVVADLNEQLSVLTDLRSQADLSANRLREREIEIEQVNAELQHQRNLTQASSQEAADIRTQAELAASQLREREVEIEQARTELERQHDLAQALSQQAGDARAQAAFIESQLRQREEEIEQTRSELERETLSAQVLAEEAGRLRERLVDADKWVFRLAGDRRQAEIEIEDSRRNLENLTKRFASEKAQAERFAAEFSCLVQQSAERAKEITHLNEKLSQAQIHSNNAIEAPQIDYAALEQAQLQIRHLRDQHGQAEYNCKMAHLELADRSAEVEMLTRMLMKSNEQAKNGTNESHYLVDECARLTKELSDLSARLEQTAHDREYEAAGREWLANLSILLTRRPFWWALLPVRWRVRLEHKRLLRQGLFDAATYLELNPDVAASGMEPVRHYAMHGIQERRRRSL